MKTALVALGYVAASVVAVPSLYASTTQGDVDVSAAENVIAGKLRVLDRKKAPVGTLDIVVQRGSISADGGLSSGRFDALYRRKDDSRPWVVFSRAAKVPPIPSLTAPLAINIRLPGLGTLRLRVHPDDEGPTLGGGTCVVDGSGPDGRSWGRGFQSVESVQAIASGSLGELEVTSVRPSGAPGFFAITGRALVWVWRDMPVPCFA